jgi:hypothetical protein
MKGLYEKCGVGGCKCEPDQREPVGRVGFTWEDNIEVVLEFSHEGVA